MTILSVTEQSRQGSQGDDLKYSYTRVYIVKSDTGLSEKQALEADDTTNAIPKINEDLADDTSAGCVSLSGKPSDDVNKLWLVTAMFKTRKGEGSYDPEDENDPDDPTTNRPVINFGSAQYTQVIDKAYKDNDVQGVPTDAILNSAGDSFDPPVQSEFSRTIIEIAYNTRTFDPDWMREYENTINKSPIVVGGAQIPARQGKMIFLNTDPLYDAQDELYYAVNVQIELNYEEYKLSLLDQGFNYLDTDESDAKTEFTVKDKDGADVPSSEPQLLDGENGYPSATAKYLDYYVNFTKEWKALNLPKEY